LACAAFRLQKVLEEPQPFGYALSAVWPQARARARALPLKTRVVIDLLAERLPPLLAAR
ncbi:MAG: LysR family transcriptional regulator, partial [Pseudomonadota bacterium]